MKTNLVILQPQKLFFSQNIPVEVAGSVGVLDSRWHLMTSWPLFKILIGPLAFEAHLKQSLNSCLGRRLSGYSSATEIQMYKCFLCLCEIWSSKAKCSWRKPGWSTHKGNDFNFFSLFCHCYEWRMKQAIHSNVYGFAMQKSAIDLQM